MTNLRNYSDIFLAIAVIGILVIMILPLPSLLLDILLALSITISILILLVSMYIIKPLEFSVFPTILLIVTLYRLGLNIASTRLILLHGNEGTTAAGNIIDAFGRFVVGGNYVVGFVIFSILVIIQFVVITKGAGRVAEVAARFTLDAMPGKQMSIDADLNAGLVTEKEAKQRRETIAREADFYGAMDGASKFVRGDAIAGLLITVINIIGGLIIGVIQMRMNLADAVQTYTILTIGDGLVTQIPALIVSTASGIVVTRAAAEADLGGDFTNQLLVHPRAIGTASVLLCVLSVVPGLPMVPFMVLSIAMGIIAYGISKDRSQLKDAKETDKASVSTIPEKVEGLLQLDPIELEIGYSLISLIDSGQGGDLVDRIKMMRRHFALDMGFVVPPVRIKDNLQLKPNSYSIKIKGIEVSQGDVMPERLMAMNSGINNEEQLEGIQAIEPTFGLPVIWILPKYKERAQATGYTIIDASSVIATHLSEVVKKNARDLLGRQDVQNLLDNLKETHPAVVEAAVPNSISLSILQKILQNLLTEGISIRDLVTILESVIDHSSIAKDPIVLTEYVRLSISRAICKPHISQEGQIKTLTLSPALENFFSDSVQESEYGQYLLIEPRMVHRIIEAMSKTLEKVNMQEFKSRPILICPSKIRWHVKKLIERHFPFITVLSYSEVSGQLSIKSLGRVELEDANKEV